ncbi:MAG TPA: hypothetical protein PLJ85_03495, partial [Candidatus Cloacimonas sp.]|nr:hypothetical protein [Candidatus Cloacimonas sp.]
MLQKFLMSVVILMCVYSSLSALRYTTLEDFESGFVSLSSWSIEEDLQPDAWSLDTSTPDSSSYCLKLTGNCYKLQQITPY